MSSYERTGWRDEALSRRHRVWGAACAGTDIDFLFVEYSFGVPAAIIEYKDWRKIKRGGVNLRDCNNLALATLANNSKIPFLIAFYWPDIWAFLALPANEFARAYFYEEEMFTEREFVDRLYQIRNASLVESLKNQLNNELPPEELSA